MIHKGSKPHLPQILTPATAVSLHRSPDNKGYVLTVTLELEFPDREQGEILFGARMST